MNVPTHVPGAKLICVEMSTIHRALNAPPMPGFYRVVWQVGDGRVLKDPATVARMYRHLLYGQVVCAN